MLFVGCCLYVDCCRLLTVVRCSLLVVGWLLPRVVAVCCLVVAAVCVC